jgi:hypothetical protein
MLRPLESDVAESTRRDRFPRPSTEHDVKMDYLGDLAATLNTDPRAHVLQTVMVDRTGSKSYVVGD